MRFDVNPFTCQCERKRKKEKKKERKKEKKKKKEKRLKSFKLIFALRLDVFKLDHGSEGVNLCL